MDYVPWDEPQQLKCKIRRQISRVVHFDVLWLDWRQILQIVEYAPCHAEVFVRQFGPRSPAKQGALWSTNFHISFARRLYDLAPTRRGVTLRSTGRFSGRIPISQSIFDAGAWLDDFEQESIRCHSTAHAGLGSMAMFEDISFPVISFDAGNGFDDVCALRDRKRSSPPWNAEVRAERTVMGQVSA